MALLLSLAEGSDSDICRRSSAPPPGDAGGGGPLITPPPPVMDHPAAHLCGHLSKVNLSGPLNPRTMLLQTTPYRPAHRRHLQFHHLLLPWLRRDAIQVEQKLWDKMDMKTSHEMCNVLVHRHNATVTPLSDSIHWTIKNESFCYCQSSRLPLEVPPWVMPQKDPFFKWHDQHRYKCSTRWCGILPASPSFPKGFAILWI